MSDPLQAQHRASAAIEVMQGHSLPEVARTAGVSDETVAGWVDTLLLNAWVLFVADQPTTMQRLREQADDLMQTLDSLGVSVFLKDLEGRYLFANRLKCEQLGRAADAIVGTADDAFLDAPTAARIRHQEQRVLEHAETVEGEETLPRSGWGLRTYWTVRKPLRDHADRVRGLCGVALDITPRKLLEEELLRLATTDDLSGTANRRHFLVEAAAVLARCRAAQVPTAFVLIDVDHFKQVNDSYGHATGDSAIRAVADACRDVVRGNDLVGRLGGEEFGVVLVGVDLAAAVSIAERLRQRVAETVVPATNGAAVRLHISAGVAVPGPREDISSLMIRADDALYAAKGAGRDRVCVAAPPSGA